MCLNLYSGPWTISVFEAISLKVNEQKSYAEHHSEKKHNKTKPGIVKTLKAPINTAVWTSAHLRKKIHYMTLNGFVSIFYFVLIFEE